MPGKKKYRFWKKGRRDHHARTIQSAWRYRNRRKTRGSLIARTTQANRQAIKNIKKQIDVKVKNDQLCAQGDDFKSGQGNNAAITVNNLGQFSVVGPPVAQITLAVNLLQLTQGPAQNQMIGNRVRMKSLAVQVWAEANDSVPWQQLHLLLVLDREANNAPANLTPDILFTPKYAGTPTNYAGGLAINYVNPMNVSKTDKSKRFNILARKKITLGSPGYKVQAYQTNAITTTAAGVSPDVYGNVTQAVNDIDGVCTGTRGGPPYGKTTLFTKAPFNIEYNPDAADDTQLPVNQTIYLYAYTLGRAISGNMNAPRFWFKANYRFTDI